jgi:hypothetical protein
MASVYHIRQSRSRTKAGLWIETSLELNPASDVHWPCDLEQVISQSLRFPIPLSGREGREYVLRLSVAA